MVAVVMTVLFIILAVRMNELLNESHSWLLEAYISDRVT